MQWILPDFEDTRKLAAALERLRLPHSWHKVVSFVGELIPEPEVADPDAVVLFGAHSLWRTAEARGWRPGVFRIGPFVHEAPWQPHLLNGPDALLVALRDLPDRLAGEERAWFVRPVGDGKEDAGRVQTSAEIAETARRVLALGKDEIPRGSPRHNTEMMLTRPVPIAKEWRLWVVGGEVVTHSLYEEGRRVVYRPEIDDDALAFARDMVGLNPGHAPAHALDV